MDKLRVLVVDDNHLILRAVPVWVSRTGVAEVGCVASDALEAMRAVEAERPDVVLCDVRMPDLDGFGLTAALVERHPGLPVVLFSALLADDLHQRALEVGARGFVDKSASTEELSEVLLRAVHGESWQQVKTEIRRLTLNRLDGGS